MTDGNNESQSGTKKREDAEDAQNATGARGASLLTGNVEFHLNMRRFILLCAIVGLTALVVVHFDNVVALCSTLIDIAMPFVVGAVLAYLINLIMAFFERFYFPKSTHPAVVRTRRPVCMVAAIAFVAAIVTAVVVLLAGELREAFESFGVGLTAAFDSLGQWVEGSSALEGLVALDVESWQATLNTMLDNLGGTDVVRDVVRSVGGSVVSVVVNAFLGLIFALYLLAGRERVVNGAIDAARIVLPRRVFEGLSHIMTVANQCFTRFFTGQCIEACILGTLCAIGMSILGFPYAGSIGLCVGITSLIPYVGAWVGGVVGALIIASISVTQALWFVVFLVILQQIEGHFIYPNVVGTAVDMPGIWVFASVIVGGSLFGIAGVLLGVPIVSTCRHLLFEWRDVKEGRSANEPSDDGSASEGGSSNGVSGDAPIQTCG